MAAEHAGLPLLVSLAEIEPATHPRLRPALTARGSIRAACRTIANYINGLVSITAYCYANLEPTDEVLQMEPNPLAQIINLRGQAEKQSRTQQMYDRRVGGWLTWEDVQKARVKSVEKLDEVQWGTAEEKRFALRDCAALSLLSLIPPDRVGCIRKARTE